MQLRLIATVLTISLLAFQLHAQLPTSISPQQPKSTSTLDSSSTTLNNQIQKPNTQKVTGETSRSQQNPKLKPNIVSKPNATPKLKLISKKQFKEYLKTALTALGVTGTIVILVNERAFNYVMGNISKVIGNAAGTTSTTESNGAAALSPTVFDRFATYLEKRREKQVKKKTVIIEASIYFSIIVGEDCSSAIKKLADLNANLNTKNKHDGDTLLHRAAHFDNVEATKQLLIHGADPNITDSKGRSAMHIAVQKNNLAIVQLLLDNNANPDSTDNHQDTALIYAIVGDHPEIARALIEGKTDINIKNSRGCSALHSAIKKDNQSIVQLLLDNNANPNDIDGKGTTALMLSCNNFSNPNISSEMVSLLLNNESCKSSINSQNQDGYTALFFAADHKDAKIMDLLIQHNADVHVKSNNNDTALMHATSEGNVGGLKLLLDHKADPHAVDKNGHNALMNAAGRNQVDAIELLLGQGTPIDDAYNDGPTALLYAAGRQSLEAVQALLKHKADPNKAQKKDGYTALHEAISKYTFRRRHYTNYLALIRFLIDAGANVNARSNDGKTPLHCAAASAFQCNTEFKDTINLLIKNDANHKAQDKDGHEPAYYAATPELKRILENPEYQSLEVMD